MGIISYLYDAFNDVLSLSDYNTLYADEMQLQEALEASMNSFSHGSPSSSSTSSSQQIISCEICCEDKENSEMFRVEGCPHLFCFVCIRKHVEYKLQNNIIDVCCPDQDCMNVIQPRSLRGRVPAEVIDRWEEAIAESSIVAWQKIQCPFQGCLEIMVNDDDDGGGVITKCECPWCHRLFCARCKVSWHQGYDCKSYQRSHRVRKEKDKLRVLAKEKNWKECPSCKVFVDKIDGCIHITCRCKLEFCYVCGAKWSDRHWKTCQK